MSRSRDGQNLKTDHCVNVGAAADVNLDGTAADTVPTVASWWDQVAVGWEMTSAGATNATNGGTLPRWDTSRGHSLYSKKTDG